MRSLPLLMTDDQQPEAHQILNFLTSIPFEQCQPLDRNFASIPPRPGLYAVRHRTDGLLYIGKTKSLRGRFSGGHKAFLWAWLDRYSDEDVRIALYLLSSWKNPTLLSRWTELNVKRKMLHPCQRKDFRFCYVIFIYVHLLIRARSNHLTLNRATLQRTNSDREVEIHADH